MSKSKAVNRRETEKPEFALRTPAFSCARPFSPVANTMPEHKLTARIYGARHTELLSMQDFIDLSNLHLEIAPDDTLRAVIEGDRCGRNVQVLRAFPLSAPDLHIVLRDGAGKELGIIERLSAVDEPRRTLLQQSLNKYYFLPRVTKINALKERYGAAIWDIETDRGPVVINTSHLIDALTEMDDGLYILRDTDGNRYEISEVEKMDEASQLIFAGK